MKILVEDVKSIYFKICEQAKSRIKKNNYIKAIDSIRAAANTAYLFNWIYSDAVLESCLFDLSNKMIKKQDFEPVAKRVVFYDSFGWDNRGLTLQYVRALISENINFLYIFENEDKDKSLFVRRELEGYSNCEILSIDNSLSVDVRVIGLYERIIDFRPDKILMHMSPWAVEAIIVFYAIRNVKKYHINLTDHAFWLGAGCLDYSIEFRDYGCTVSIEKRGLKEEQLLVNPYYPICSDVSFKGFPVDVSSNVVIFSGSSFYKIYGRGSAFLSISKKILNENPEALIFFAGSGEGKHLEDFIKNNNLENRFFLIGDREDIGEIFTRCDIYLSTYPITGGLMSQLAAYYSKPILSYTTPDIQCNFVEGIVCHANSLSITKTNEAEFYKETSELVRNKSLRIERGAENKRALITKDEFDRNCLTAFFENKSPFAIGYNLISYGAFTDLYLEVEGRYQDPFKRLFFKYFGFYSFVYFPFFAVKAFFSILPVAVKRFARKISV